MKGQSDDIQRLFFFFLGCDFLVQIFRGGNGIGIVFVI